MFFGRGRERNSHGPMFFDLPKVRLEKDGIGNEGFAYQLQCVILAVQFCPCTLGRREARPLTELSPPRATASPLGPQSSRPEADPQLTLPKCTRAKSEPIKNDQTMLFPAPWPNRRAIASHQTAPFRPTTRMAAGECFFIICSFSGPNRVHPNPINKRSNTIKHDRTRGPSKTIKKRSFRGDGESIHWTAHDDYSTCCQKPVLEVTTSSVPSLG